MQLSEMILVVEDNPELREDLVMVLASEGYRVSHCGTGTEALELTQKQSFDLIVSDIRMPGIDGLETIDRVLQRQPDVATLVITGFTDEEDSIRAVQLGVGDYLRKPFALDDFLAAVGKQLRKHRARRQEKQREQSLLEAARWSLGKLSRQLLEDARGPEVAWEMARELGLPPAVCTQIQLAVTAELCERVHPEVMGWQLLPGEVRTLLEEVRHGEQTRGLPARVAAMILDPGTPGESDLSLEAAHERAQRRVEGTLLEPPPGPRRQVWLQMGRSQEILGEAQALSYYERILEEPWEDPERVEALLAAARIKREHPTEALTLVENAVSLARQLNGLLYCVTCLEAGHQLLDMGLSRQAVGLFEQAGRWSRELGQPLLEARATLSLIRGGSAVDSEYVHRAVTTLSDLNFRFELLDASGWLAPTLLGLQVASPHPSQEKALQILGRDAPRSLLRHLQEHQLSSAEKVALAQALRMAQSGPADECLRLLKSDADEGVRSAAQQVAGAGRANSAPPRPTLRIACLGPFEVYCDHQRVPELALRSPKPRYLLARLAGATRPLVVDQVIDEFWPDTGERGRASLNVSVSQLRKVLRGPDWPDQLDYLKRDAIGMRLNPELTVWHDLTEFLALSEPTQGGEQDRISRWKRAVQLYRGPYLEDCYMDWALSLRDVAEQAMLRCLRELLQLLSAHKRWAEVLEYANRLVALDSCCQDGHLAAMNAHLWLGRPEAALRQFETCKRQLARELNLEPNLALMEAYQRAML